MNRPVRYLIAAGAVAAAALLALAANPWLAANGAEVRVDAQVRAVLDRLAEAYADTQTYSGSITLTQRVVETGGVQDSEAVSSVVAQRPNMFRVELGSDRGDWTFTCDGQHYYVHFEHTNKYMQLPAPADLQGAFGREPLAKLVPGRLQAVGLGLFAPDPAAALLEGATRTEYAGAEETALGEADHVVVHTDADSLHLWVTREQPDLVKAELKPWGLLAELRAQRPDLKDVQIILERGPAQVNAELPEDAFAFAPPEGAREAEDMKQMLEVDLKGKEMIDFRLPGLKEGAEWQLADHRGKVIALDFWATWCPPCRAELPELAKIHNDYRDREFLLLGVNVAEDRKTVGDFLDGMGVSIPVALDAGGNVAGRYGASSLPTLLLIGKTGRVEAVHVGYAPGVEKVIRREIDTLLKGESLLEG